MNSLKQRIVQEIIKKSGINIEIDTFIFQNILHTYNVAYKEIPYGCYSRHNDTIYWPEVNGDRRLYTLFHELAHATGNQKRLHRRMNKVTLLDEAIEEYTADVTAQIILNEFNLLDAKTQMKIDSYLYSWSVLMDSDSIKIAKKQAAIASVYILTNWLSDTLYMIKNEMKSA